MSSERIHIFVGFKTGLALYSLVAPMNSQQVPLCCILVKETLQAKAT
jgi:hypothetical protein